ncbi:PAS domain-containing protein [Neobacillus drentensis]|uniref:PAS domain-containing protein n=1 Tax=Neobacillus drentensis TaxID=220684 RepID=UPI002FFE2063
MDLLFSESSNAIYKSIIDYNPDAIFVLTVDGTIADVNQVVTKILGYSKEDLLGINYEKIVGSEYVEFTNHQFKKVLQGTPCEYETQAIHKNGEIVYLHVKNVPFAESRVVVGVLGVAKNITKQKQLENSLKESEGRYRRLVELSPEPIIVHKTGIIRYINKVGAHLFGAKNSNEIIGRSILDFVSPDARKNAIERIAYLQKAEGNTIEMIERKMIRLDGSPFYIQFSGVGKIYEGKLSVQLMLRDITDQKQAEEALRKSEERYRLIAENMKDLVCEIEKDGCFIYFTLLFNSIRLFI